MSFPGLVVAVALLLGACSGGGGGGGDATDPIEWARFRRDGTNRGLASGSINGNRGAVTALFPLDPERYGVTSATPIIGADGTIYLGTAHGLLAMNKAGEAQWLFDRCELPSGTIEVGSISGSASITTEDDIVVGTDSGHVFALHSFGTSFACKWVHAPPGVEPSPIVSSPALLVDVIDRSLITVYLGTGAGYLQALNGDGTEQWRFPRDGETLGALTASPALGGDGGLYLTTPEGYLQAVDTAGRLRWRTRVDASQGDADLLPSPAIGSSLYAIGAVRRCELSGAVCDSDQDCADDRCLPTNGQVTAVNPDGTVKWRYATETAVLGSPIALLQTVVVDRVNEGGTTSVIDTVVYVVDDAGTVYGLRDQTGGLLEVRDPDDDTIRKSARLRLMANGVSTSPVISSDLFVVFASDDGHVYAIRLDTDAGNTRPCPECTDAQWEPSEPGTALEPDGGARVCVKPDPTQPDGCAPIRFRSSPIIDRNGTIYVTADDGVLYAIEAP